MEPAGECLVEGATRDLRQPILYGLAVGSFAGVVVGLIAWSADGWEPALAAMCGIVGVFLTMGLLQAGYWYVRAGRTTYEMVDNHFIVRRAGRDVKAWPCSQIHAIEFGDAPRFHQTMFHKSGGGLPVLRVVADEGSRIGTRIDYRIYQGWTLLRTSPHEVDAAERRVRDAVANSRE